MCVCSVLGFKCSTTYVALWRPLKASRTRGQRRAHYVAYIASRTSASCFGFWHLLLTSHITYISSLPILSWKVAAHLVDWTKRLLYICYLRTSAFFLSGEINKSADNSGQNHCNNFPSISGMGGFLKYFFYKCCCSYVVVLIFATSCAFCDIDRQRCNTWGVRGANCALVVWTEDSHYRRFADSLLMNRCWIAHRKPFFCCCQITHTLFPKLQRERDSYTHFTPKTPQSHTCFHALSHYLKEADTCLYLANILTDKH